MHKLTSKEKIVLGRLIDRLYAEPGFSDVVTGELTDTDSMFGIYWEDGELNSHAVRGVLSSLGEKGLVWSDKDSGYEIDGEAIIYLDESGFCYHKEWAEEEGIEYIDLSA